MSEEKEGFFSQIKNQIITTIGIVITAAGGLLVTNMEAIFSPAQEEVVQEVVNDSVVSQPNIIINVPEQKVKEKIIIKEVPVVKKKEKEETLDW